MRLLRWIGLLFLLVGLPVSAQEAWEVWLYDGLRVHILTADGIQRAVAVPAGAQGIQYSAGVSNEYYRQVRVSPDHYYLVYADSHLPNDGTPPTASLQIANLVGQTCCFALPTPFPGHADTIIVGPFSPDGQQVAALITRVYGTIGFDFIGVESVVIITAVQSPVVSQRLSPMEVFGDVGVFFGEWDEAGIKLVPTCLACEGSTSGFYSNWNPFTNEVTPNAGYFHVGGDRLLATTEHIQPGQNPKYPIDSEPSRGGWNNVIEYFATGNPADAVVIYHDSSDLKLGAVKWVIDGLAYLLYPKVIFRDGTVQTVDNLSDLLFITGTPDGWVMQGRESHCLYYYQYQAGVITPRDLGCLPRTVTVLDAPILDGGGGQITPVIR